MIINSLELKNFLSHENSRIDFDLGVNLITGKNGAGKSSIIDGIKFAMFGDSRGSSIADLVKRGKSEMAVSMEFSIGPDNYRVTRTMSLGRSGVKNRDAVLHKNNVEIARTVSGVTQAVEDLLGIGKELFLNSVFVEQGEISSLVSENKADREKTFSHILGLNILQQMAHDLQESVRELKVRGDSIENAIAKLNVAEERVTSISAEIKEEKEQLDQASSHSANLKKALDEARWELDSIRERIGELETASRRSVEIEEQISDLRQNLEMEDDLIRRAEESIQEASSEIDQKLMDMQDRIMEYLDLSSRRSAEVPLLESLRSRFSRLQDLRSELQALQKSHNRYSELENEIQAVMDRRKSLEVGEKKFLSASSEMEQISKRIANLRERVSRIQSAVLKAGIAFSDSSEIATRKSEIELERGAIEGRMGEIKARVGQLNSERLKIAQKLSEIRGSSVCPLCKQPLSQNHLEEIIADYQKEDADILKDILSLSQEKKTLEARKSQISVEIERLSRPEITELFHLREELALEEKQASISSKALDELRHLHSEFETANERSSEIENEIRSLRQDEIRFQSLKKNITDLEAENLQSKIEEMEITLKQIEGRMKNIAEVMGMIPDSDTRRRLDKSREALSRSMDMRISLASRKESRAGLQRQIDSLSSQLDSIRKTLIDLPELRKLLEEKIVKVEEATELWEKNVSLTSTLRGKLEKLESSLKEALRERDEALAEVNRISKIREALQKMELIRNCFDRDGIQKTIRRDSATFVTNMMREYSISFNLNFDDVRVGEDMSIEVSQNGSMESIDMLSGGEKTALAIALRLAIVKYVNDSIKTMIMDEPTIFLDEDRRQNLTEILQYSFNGEENPIPQMIIVSHHSELRSVSNNIFEVYKAGGSSFVRGTD